MFKICHLLISPYCSCSVICVCCPRLLCMPSHRFVDSFTLAMKAFTPKRSVNATHVSFPLFESQLVSIRQHTTMSSSRRQWLGLKTHEHLEQACRHYKRTFRFLPEKPQKNGSCVHVSTSNMFYMLPSSCRDAKRGAISSASGTNKLSPHNLVLLYCHYHH